MAWLCFIFVLFRQHLTENKTVYLRGIRTQIGGLRQAHWTTSSIANVPRFLTSDFIQTEFAWRQEPWWHGRVPASSAALALVFIRSPKTPEQTHRSRGDRTWRRWVIVRWRLRRLPVDGQARSALRRPDWSLVGVDWRSHEGQGSLVLPRGGDGGVCQWRKTRRWTQVAGNIWFRLQLPTVRCERK